ncbi:hypothetical protein MnTg02_01461 [bacterium MnTg02]|nr:hypothetical protein MnTg02_01461 [bacterium MnTg02]
MSLDYAELEQILESELHRRSAKQTAPFAKYQSQPIAFVEKALGGFLWSKQREICESVQENRFTAVKSCHSVGKTAIAARLATWWLSVHPPGEAFLVTSAPTWDQVRALLWREINTIHKNANLPGRTNQTEWLFGNELVGYGRAVRETDPTSFQGIHARYVLVVLDEACGISSAVWEAAETLVANDSSRFLAIGNPDDPATEFARSCKPGSHYHVIRISAFDSPNFTGEDVPDLLNELLVSPTWVEERRKKWGESSPLWISKVTGEFPETSSDGLIPLNALTRALECNLEPIGTNELGVDVGRFGSDSTVIYHRRGPVARRISSELGNDLMTTAGNVVKAIKETGATAVKIDDIGSGGGVTDRLSELRMLGEINAEIVGINVSNSPINDVDLERFQNQKAQLNFAVRDRFIEGRIDIDENNDLLKQAAEIKYKLTSRGKILMEPKEVLKQRGLPSPDDWDALILAFAPTETGTQMLFDTQNADILCQPIKPFDGMPHVAALAIDHHNVGVVWGMIDEKADIIYLYAEYFSRRKDLAIHAHAMKQRGHWIPILFDPRAAGRSEEIGERLTDQLLDLDVDLFTIELSQDVGFSEIEGRLSTGRLKVYDTLQNWSDQYQKIRRKPDGSIDLNQGHLIEAMALICAYGREAGITEAQAMGPGDDDYSAWSDPTRNPTTGY